MTNLLDERIDCHQSMDWQERGAVRPLFCGFRYKGIADTIVQLLHRNTSGVIAPTQSGIRLAARRK
jgi:hypothetical protein